MKRASSLIAAFALVSVTAASVFAQILAIGDTAPPLSIAEWVRGRPVDLAKDAEKRFHVIEFWATWCPPCKESVPLLTQYQKRYGKDVTIIGVSQPDLRGNTPSAIRRFVEDQGPKMEYTIAIDTGRTTETYMGTGASVGIPHAFVVGKDGKIVWQGSPLDPAMDDVLGQLVAGTYDIQSAKTQEKVAKRMSELNVMAQLGQWQAVWDGLVGILKIDPANQTAIEALVTISGEGLNEPEALCTWVDSHVAANGTNVKAMQRLANALLSINDLRRRCPDLALKAAKAAYAASPKPDAQIIAGYARAHYEIGKLDRAIALQEDALAVVHDEGREEVQDVLEYYRMCKRLSEAGDD